MKKFHLLLCLLCISNLNAQTRKDPYANEILSKITLKYKALKGFRAVYEHSAEMNGGKKSQPEQAEILVKNNKYHLKIGKKQEVFCDGKTVWSYLATAKETNISDYEPDANEITPDRIYNFYEKGFKYVMIGEVKEGSDVLQTIDIEPEDITKEFSKIRMFVRKSDLSIRKWIIFERGTNNKQIFKVLSFQEEKKLTDKDFTYDKAKFPGAKLIDLR